MGVIQRPHDHLPGRSARTDHQRYVPADHRPVELPADHALHALRILHRSCDRIRRAKRLLLHRPRLSIRLRPWLDGTRWHRHLGPTDVLQRAHVRAGAGPRAVWAERLVVGGGMWARTVHAPESYPDL